MIEDCRRHKLDLILVKSVSRFSRDTVDALETTRELKRLGIPVYFDLESINSFQPDFELYYSVYAAVAQSDRESNHDNLAISIQHKIKDGTSKLYSRPCYGYKLDRNGEFVIVQEEAEVVKLVFNLYLDGLSILGIMRELEQRGITSPSGKAKWCRRSIDLMLENEKYRGNSVATAPTLSDAPKDLPRRRYMLSMHHEGIVASFKNPELDGVEVPKYFILHKDELLNISNICFDRLLPAYQQFEMTPFLADCANTMLLDLISAYDEATGKRQKALYNTAIAFAEWLLDTSDDMLGHNVKLLNKSQLIKRKRAFTYEERQLLLNMEENSPESDDIRVGIYLLLDDQERAERYYQKLDEKTKTAFMQYPIYKFWKHSEA